MLKVSKPSISQAAVTQDVLFAQHSEWARWLARKVFDNTRIEGADIDDFEQLAYEGLLMAIASFDVDKGIKFRTFAEHRVRGNILNHVSKVNESSAHYCKIGKDINKSAETNANNTNNADPTGRLVNLISELSIEYLLQKQHEVTDTLNVYQGSLYSSPEFELMSNRVNSCVEKLKEPKRGIVKSHYFKGWSFTAIAQLLKMTKGRVSQLHSQAIAEIKKALAW